MAVTDFVKRVGTSGRSQVGNELGLKEMLLDDPFLLRGEDGVSQVSEDREAETEGKKVFEGPREPFF